METKIDTIIISRDDKWERCVDIFDSGRKNEWIRNLQDLSILKSIKQYGLENETNITDSWCKDIENFLDGDSEKKYYIVYLITQAENPKHVLEALKWFLNGVLPLYKEGKLSTIISGIKLLEFSKAIVDGKINPIFTKSVFDDVLNSNLELIDILSKECYIIQNDGLEKLIDELILNNKDQFDSISKNPKIKQWFVGQVFKSGMKTSPSSIIEILDRKLL